MQFTNIAYAKGYDTNIIGGFMRDKVAELFELEENLVPVMLIALGKKEKDGRPSVRIKAEKLVRFE
jgi:Nitroreductase family.